MTDENATPPYKRWRHPPGCPDSDWCSGNRVCYWDCQGTDDDEPEESPIQARAAGIEVIEIAEAGG